MEYNDKKPSNTFVHGFIWSNNGPLAHEKKERKQRKLQQTTKNDRYSSKNYRCK